MMFINKKRNGFVLISKVVNYRNRLITEGKKPVKKYSLSKFKEKIEAPGKYVLSKSEAIGAKRKIKRLYKGFKSIY